MTPYSRAQLDGAWPAQGHGRTRSETGLRAAAVLPTVSEALVEALAALGISEAFGMVGGAIGVFAEALACGAPRVIHCRHESGAAFAATEAYFATGRPALLFATTGPGLSNSLNGILSARWEGAKLVVVSGVTPPRRRGRGAFQETHAQTLPPDLYQRGTVFDYVATLHDPEQLPEVVARLAVGLGSAGGFIAHIALPSTVQDVRLDQPRPPLPRMVCPAPAPNEAAVADCVKALSEHRAVIWVGFGARRAAALVRELAERTNAPVICSPRAKGIFPERHPQFWGIPGFAGYGGAGQRLSDNPPDHLLVLGTRLSEFTSTFNPALAPRLGIFHVDLDPGVVGAAYPGISSVAIHADVGEFVHALLRHIPPASVRPLVRPALACAQHTDLPSSRAVRPQALMQALQTEIIDATKLPILVDVGNAFAWAIHLLRFDEPGRFRASTRWASMGCAAAGVVGAALASGRKALALVGDGALLMQNEISTAVRYGAPAVWVVLNDQQYGMIEQGARGANLQPVETAIPPVDFVMLARALGADGTRVHGESELASALATALRSPSPFVVDVIIDRAQSAPIGKRNDSLMEQMTTHAER